jgi:hypothetical protein
VARNDFLARALFRLRGPASADDRDVERALRRALKRAGRREGDPQAVQVAGQPLEAEDYARWRDRKLRRGAISSAPELAPGRYALVLVAIEPSTTEQFIRHGAGRHLRPPAVGEFRPAIEPTVALAGTLASWRELFRRAVVLAPPLLYTGERWRVAKLGFDWPLAPYGRERR